MAYPATSRPFKGKGPSLVYEFRVATLPKNVYLEANIARKKLKLTWWQFAITAFLGIADGCRAPEALAYFQDIAAKVRADHPDPDGWGSERFP